MRLPIPPPPHCQNRYFFGAGCWGADGGGADCCGAGVDAGGTGNGICDPGAGAFPGLAGALLAGAFCLSRTLPEAAALRVARIASESEVIINSAAAIVVAFDSTVAEPRGPKAVCEPIPPNAPAKSAAFPLCNNTTTTRKKQTMTWIIVNKIVMQFYSGGFNFQCLDETGRNSTSV